jgi:hypothetical protein
MKSAFFLVKLVKSYGNQFFFSAEGHFWRQLRWGRTIRLGAWLEVSPTLGIFQPRLRTPSGDFTKYHPSMVC